MDVDIRACGIPCRASITSYTAGYDGGGLCDPDRREEPYPPDFEFELLDLRGRPAKWLEDKVEREGRWEEVEEAVFLALERAAGEID